MIIINILIMESTSLSANFSLSQSKAKSTHKHNLSSQLSPRMLVDDEFVVLNEDAGDIMPSKKKKKPNFFSKLFLPNKNRKRKTTDHVSVVEQVRTLSGGKRPAVDYLEEEFTDLSPQEDISV